MRLTERDRLVLARTLTSLPWFGMPTWTLRYDFRRGAAFALYVNLYRLYFSKYRGHYSHPGDNS